MSKIKVICTDKEVIVDYEYMCSVFDFVPYSPYVEIGCTYDVLMTLVTAKCDNKYSFKDGDDLVSMLRTAAKFRLNFKLIYTNDMVMRAVSLLRMTNMPLRVNDLLNNMTQQAIYYFLRLLTRDEFMRVCDHVSDRAKEKFAEIWAFLYAKDTLNSAILRVHSSVPMPPSPCVTVDDMLAEHLRCYQPSFPSADFKKIQQFKLSFCR